MFFRKKLLFPSMFIYDASTCQGGLKLWLLPALGFLSSRKKSEEQSVFWETSKTLKFGCNKRNGSTSKRGPGKPFANQLTPSKTEFWPSWLFNVLSSTFFRRGLGSSRNGDDEATRIESSPSQERGNYFLFFSG